MPDDTSKIPPDSNDPPADPRPASKAKPTRASTATKTRTRRKSRPLPPYNVVLLNDDDHSYEYVIEMLRALFGHNEQMGFKLAQVVDTTGRAIVYTTHKELAELKRDQIHGYGADQYVATSCGSMTAIVEPASTK